MHAYSKDSIIGILTSFFFSTLNILSSLSPHLHTLNPTQVARHLDSPASEESCYSGIKDRIHSVMTG